MSAPGGGYKIESQESRALASINTESYDYRDQAKLLTKLTGDVSYLAQYTRQMQKGIDSANQNFIQQIQDLINEILVLIGGGGDTGFDFGDLKYIFQAIGALFGFDTVTGIASIFPINLFSAAWHFFSTYIIPLDNLGEFIDWIIDQFVAMILDVFGDIPIVGQALQQLFVWITQIRDVLGAFGTMFGSWTKSLVDFIVNTVNFLWDLFGEWTEPIVTFVFSTVSFLWGLFQNFTAPLVTFIVDTVTFLWNLFSEWTEPIVTFVISVVTWISDIFEGFTKAIVDFITATLDWLVTLFNGWTGDLVQWILDGITAFVTIFAEWTEPIATWVTSTLNFLWGLFSTWTAPFVSVIGQVVQAVQDIVDWFVGGVGSAISALFPWAKKLPQMQIINEQEVIKTTNVPELDATKITTGSLPEARVGNLPATKITTGQFLSDRIADSAITTPKLNDSAVTGAKVSNLAITSGKINDIDGSKISSGSVAEARIANLSAGKITTGQFGTAFISDNAITTNKIGTDAVTNAKIATDAVGTNEIAADAITTTEIANLAVTGVKTTGLDAAKITTGTINAALLPNTISAVGSGISMSRTNGAGGGDYTCTFGGDGELLPYGFYNSIGNNTTDLQYINQNGKTAVKALNAGWYMIEVGFQLNTTFVDYHWGITPLFALNSITTIYKWGTTAINSRDTALNVNETFSPFFVQSSFIAYVPANQYIVPGYLAHKEFNGSGTAVLIKPTAASLGTYFSVSLLNRSLA